MPNFQFEVYCKCGNGLCNHTKIEDSKLGPVITIDPCDKCITRASEEGYDKGYDTGHKDGYADAESKLKQEDQ